MPPRKIAKRKTRSPQDRHHHSEFKRILDEHRLTYKEAATIIGRTEKTVYRLYNGLTPVHEAYVITLKTKLQGKPKP